MATPVTDDSQTLGEYWPKIREQYPRLEPQPPLPPMSEDFGPPAPPSVSFQLLSGPIGGRYWLLNDAQSEVVQVQPDRFAYNWRKDPGDEAYPGYPYLRKRFYEVFSLFDESVRLRGVPPVPTWCEITYINPIPVDRTDVGHSDLSCLLRRLVPEALSVVDTPEDTTLVERFVLRRDGVPYGRFHVQVTPSFRVDNLAPLYLVTLTVRAEAPTPDLAGVIAMLDEGHDLIVRTFRDMTTSEMHKEWEAK